jgi:hypothetical protein
MFRKIHALVEKMPLAEIEQAAYLVISLLHIERAKHPVHDSAIDVAIGRWNDIQRLGPSHETIREAMKSIT